MKTLILCGGKGTRAYPHTETVPKPLLEVADIPVVRHVMEIYAAQGFADFVLASGYLADAIAEFAERTPADWIVEVVDTGTDTNTGARIEMCREILGARFFATYADGLGNIDLHALLHFHESHSGSATMTTVPLPSPYGTIQLDASRRVFRFTEKPSLPDHEINAGFFVFDEQAFEHWEGDDLEREVLPALGTAGELFAYRHGGFWKSMDTYKDALELTALHEEGSPPWMTSATLPSS